MTSPADRLLGRLDGVRETAARQWVARCPSHDDRSPSLSVRELDDGTLLVHCFGGCDASDVLGAVGLGLADLYPKRPDDHRRHGTRPRQRWDCRGLLQLLAREADVVALCALELGEGRALQPLDLARLRDAHRRVHQIAEVAHAQ